MSGLYTPVRHNERPVCSIALLGAHTAACIDPMFIAVVKQVPRAASFDRFGVITCVLVTPPRNLAA
ncbi:MAG TPA: hypothetical protein VGN72_00125 [Tepidisphaeraceae bacterium]|nr:hypothetical protein [Tepidisphaeraceae bacterium]